RIRFETAFTDEEPEKGAQTGEFAGYGTLLQLLLIQMSEEVSNQNVVNGLKRDLLCGDKNLKAPEGGLIGSERVFRNRTVAQRFEKRIDLFFHLVLRCKALDRRTVCAQ